MDKWDRETDTDDGIVSEDITQLVEHIELTGPQRLVDSPGWELATPAADLDDAPIMIDEVDDLPGFDSRGGAEDLEFFTETQFDIGRHLPAGERQPDAANALAVERARWQKRVDRLLTNLAERDQVISERDRRIEELSARLATRTLEREGIALELRDARRDAGLAEGDDSLQDIGLQPAQPVVVPVALDATAELPRLELPRAVPAAAPEASAHLRRYLLGIDVVGSVHELTQHRVNIGRTHDNDLRIVDPTVSRLHAMLTVRNGEAMVVDANSRNGLFVNGIQVRYAKLEDGDLLTFGTVRFRYRVGAGTAGGAYASA